MRGRPRDWLLGAGIVAKRDFMSNAMSVRVLFISILMLFVMVGAAFGLSGLGPSGPGIQNDYVMWFYPAYPTNGTTAGIVAWVSSAFGVARANVAVSVGDRVNPTDPNPTFRVRATRLTNASGWATFPSLGAGYWPLQMQVGVLTSQSLMSVDSAPPAGNYTVWLRRFDVIGDAAYRDIGLQAIRTNGMPAAGAEVRVNGTTRGTTDGNGFFAVRLDTGQYGVDVVFNGEVWRQDVVVRQPSFFIPLASGPNNILFFLAYVLMGLFGPIVAIALSYDALAKERFQGSLELLLVRPASRAGLAIGKFLGTFASVAVPVIGVQLAALAGIAGLTGKWPDAGFATAFVFGTLGLLATYVLIMQIFSTVMKSPGTAILSAIMVWLFFNILWDVIFLFVASAARVEGGTPAYFALNNVFLLINPTGVYQLLVTAAEPASLQGAFGASLYGLAPAAPAVALVLWILVLLGLAIYVFAKKIV